MQLEDFPSREVYLHIGEVRAGRAGPGAVAMHFYAEVPLIRAVTTGVWGAPLGERSHQGRAPCKVGDMVLVEALGLDGRGRFSVRLHGTTAMTECAPPPITEVASPRRPSSNGGGPPMRGGPQRAGPRRSLWTHARGTFPPVTVP